MFLDIHTHASSSIKNSIYNVVLGEDVIPNEGWFSVGIHPWYLEDYKKNLSELESLLSSYNSKLLFIGECGLDKVVSNNYQIQEKVFNAQIELSEKHKKPLIIHCVKAYNELIKIKKITKPSQNWIIHGFNRKFTIAKELLKEGFYLSFGFNYLETELGKEAIRKIPIEKLFLETDDDDTVRIKEVYILAGEILDIELEELKKQIKKNLCQVTGWNELNY